MDLEARYDAVPFPCRPMPPSHPDNLAVLARLFGLTPAPVDACRVLELGCGDGANLLPLACNLPASEILGIDLSPAQIATGVRTQEALGLTNLELRHGDVVAFAEADPGEFDYVLCPGVFSWVPPPVQEAILAACRRHLAHDGIAFVSFNAYPGAHLVELLRSMLLRHVQGAASLEEEIRRARELLAVMAAAGGQPDNSCAQALAFDVARLAGLPDAYLLHEYLAPFNSSFYIEDFAARAAAHGLQWLADATPDAMVYSAVPAEVASFVARADDPVRAQQLLDMARGRRFCGALLCRAERAVRRPPRAGRVPGLWLYADVQPDPAAGDLSSPEPVPIRAGQRTAAVTGPALRLALSIATQAAPRSVAWEDLTAAIRERLGGGELDEEALAADILTLYFNALVGLGTHQPAMVTQLSERPRASPLAIHQATEQDWATDQWHRVARLEARERQVLALLDGSRTLAELGTATGRGDVAEVLTGLATRGLLVG